MNFEDGALSEDAFFNKRYTYSLNGNDALNSKKVETDASALGSILKKHLKPAKIFKRLITPEGQPGDQVLQEAKIEAKPQQLN